MRRYFEPRSLAVGCATGVVGLLLLGAASPQGEPAVGRFQVAGTGQGAAVIIDTATGEAWSSGTKPQIRAMDAFWGSKIP